MISPESFDWVLYATVLLATVLIWLSPIVFTTLYLMVKKPNKETKKEGMKTNDTPN